MDNPPPPPAPPPESRGLPTIVIVAIVAIGIPFLLAIALSVIAMVGGLVAYLLTARSVREMPEPVYADPVLDEWESIEPVPVAEPLEPPVVEVDEPTTGSLEATTINAVMKKHLSGMRSCYERELENDPALGGKVTIAFTIGTSGKVTQAEVASSDMDNAKVEECLVKRVISIKFPEPEGGAVKASYPMVFTAPTD